MLSLSSSANKSMMYRKISSGSVCSTGSGLVEVRVVVTVTGYGRTSHTPASGHHKRLGIHNE